MSKPNLGKGKKIYNKSYFTISIPSLLIWKKWNKFLINSISNLFKNPLQWCSNIYQKFSNEEIKWWCFWDPIILQQNDLFDLENSVFNWDLFGRIFYGFAHPAKHFSHKWLKILKTVQKISPEIFGLWIVCLSSN